MSIRDRIKDFLKSALGEKAFNKLYDPYYERKIIRRTRYIQSALYKWPSMWGGYWPLLTDIFQTERSDGRHCISQIEEGIYYSQCGQDRFVSFLFGDKKEGVFLDIGANHPTYLNNTYHFEKMGWKGLAFEPLEKYQNEWENRRKTRCLNIALGTEDKEIEFIEFDKDYLSQRADISVEEGDPDISGRSRHIIRVKQRKLNDILNEYNIHEVDYCSLDVEGCELEILDSIDFETNIIKCFSIENIDDPKMIFRIRKFMKEHGYLYIARLSWDDVFVDSRFFQKWW